MTLGEVMRYLLIYLLLYLTLEYFPECIVFGAIHIDRFLPADAVSGIRLLLFAMKMNSKLSYMEYFIDGGVGVFRAALATLMTILYTLIAVYSPLPSYSSLHYHLYKMLLWYCFTQRWPERA
jgi:hypothetical protein